jgi:hypothetical protein
MPASSKQVAWIALRHQVRFFRSGLPPHWMGQQDRAADHQSLQLGRVVSGETQDYTFSVPLRARIASPTTDFRVNGAYAADSCFSLIVAAVFTPGGYGIIEAGRHADERTGF